MSSMYGSRATAVSTQNHSVFRVPRPRFREDLSLIYSSLMTSLRFVYQATCGMLHPWSRSTPPSSFLRFYAAVVPYNSSKYFRCGHLDGLDAALLNFYCSVASCHSAERVAVLLIVSSLSSQSSRVILDADVAKGYPDETLLIFAAIIFNRSANAFLRSSILESVLSQLSLLQHCSCRYVSA